MTLLQIDRRRRLFGRKSRTGFCGWAALLSISVLCGPARGFDDYHLGVGDVLEITVAGMPDLHQRLTVQLDGSISFPYVHQVMVAGSTLSETQKVIQAALSSRLLKQRLADGREIMVAIEPGEVSAVIAEYRPIYVSGDVARPGEQLYRPLMTVRQAVSVAGGFDVFRASTKAPTSEIADAQGEKATVSAELAKEAANIGRLRRELGEKNVQIADVVDTSALSPELLQTIQKNQADLLASDQADYDRERAFLKRSAEKLADQSGVLARQQHDEDEGVKIDSEDVEKLAGLFKTGAVTGQRVNDARRAMLLSSTRSLQATSQLMQMTRQQDDLDRQLERLDDQRRIKLLSELSDRNARLHELKSRAQALDRKLLGLNARPDDNSTGPRVPNIHVIRKAMSGDPERFTADLDAELRPGDVVEVTLQVQSPLAATTP